MKRVNLREVKHPKYKELIGYQEIKVTQKTIILQTKAVGREKSEKRLENNDSILIKYILFIKYEKQSPYFFYYYFLDSKTRNTSQITEKSFARRAWRSFFISSF